MRHERGRIRTSNTSFGSKLVFLAYALLASGGPLRIKIREYVSARNAGSAAQDVLTALAHDRDVDPERPTIIEFTDFQCPYCQDMHDILMEAVRQTGSTLSSCISRLSGYILAKPAAKASLRAEAQQSAVRSTTFSCLPASGWTTLIGCDWPAMRGSRIWSNSRSAL